MERNERKSKNRVTIKDVAKASGVSIATVSYVLNNKPGQSISEDTRKKVLQFANILGYECNIMAKYLATGKTNTVSVVVKDINPIAAQYYFKLITELSRLLWRQNFGLKIVDYYDVIKRNTDCDAYITLALSEKEFREFADTKYIPVVAIDSVFDDFLFFRINDDYKQLCDKTKSEFNYSNLTLLTFGLPEEVKNAAAQAFGDIAIIDSLTDLHDLDKQKSYVTTSSLIYENAKLILAVQLESSSFALKATAAAEAVIKTIKRTTANADNHDIRV